MSIDLLTEYNWNDPESLGECDSVTVTFTFNDPPDDRYFRSACGYKRYVVNSGCDISFIELPSYGLNEFILSWADLVVHGPSIIGRGGVYYVSDNGNVTLTWLPCECIWQLDVLWPATANSNGISLSGTFRYPTSVPLYTWQRPPPASGDYYGIVMDEGSQIPVCTHALVRNNCGDA